MSEAATPVELLIVTIARLLAGVRHVAVGASSPIPGAAALLTRAQSDGATRVSVLGSRRHNAFTNGGVELFDMKKDPKQYTNLAAKPEFQAQVNRLKSKLAEKLRRVRDNDLAKH